MNKKLLVFIVGAAVVVAGVWYISRKSSEQPSGSPTPSVSMNMLPSPTPTPTPRPSTSRTPTPSPTAGLIIHETQVFNVKIENFAFAPMSLTVKQGDVVVFKNMDTTIHTATAINGSFDSGTIGTGQQWTLATANLAPGTYTFHCSIHPSMQGTLTIQ